MFEIPKAGEKTGKEGQLPDKWFTCASKAYDFDSGEEFIAVATSEGRIYKLKEQVPGQFTKEIAFTMGIISPITTMISDAKSRHLLIGLGGGEITLLKCSIDQQWDMINCEPSPNSYNHNPATCSDVLSLGLNMFVVGFASGTVRIYYCENGKEICEIAAHSRQVNALVAHPTK